MAYRSLRLHDEIVAVVDGRFDGAVAPQAWTDLVEAIGDGVRRVIVDVSAAEEIDEGAIAVLAAIAIEVIAVGGHLFLAAGEDRLTEIHDVALLRETLGR